MELNEILVFARVVRAGSFRAAAAELGMPNPEALSGGPCRVAQHRTRRTLRRPGGRSTRSAAGSPSFTRSTARGRHPAAPVPL